MSQATYFYTYLRFGHQTFNSKQDVQFRLDEVNEEIGLHEKHLRFLAFQTEPKKWVDDNTDPEWKISHDVDDSFEALSELYVERANLGLLLSRWEKCHTPDGLAIAPKEDSFQQCLEGDFVLTDKHPTRESLLE